MTIGKGHWAILKQNLVVYLVNKGKTYQKVGKETTILHNTALKIMIRHNPIGVTAIVVAQGRKRKITGSTDQKTIIQVQIN